MAPVKARINHPEVRPAEASKPEPQVVNITIAAKGPSRTRTRDDGRVETGMKPLTGTLRHSVRLTRVSRV